MEFTLLDFLVGMFAANSLPHLIFALMEIRFFSPFGFSKKGNLMHSILNLVLALGLYLYQVQKTQISPQSVLIGVLYIYCAFAIVGAPLYRRWSKAPKHTV